MHKYAAQMHALFRGNESSHGVCKLEETEDSGKVGSKNVTLSHQVTDELWSKHLEGKQGLGIVPIDDKNRCQWGCIDIDEYPAPIKEILADLNRHKLPLYPIYSKSRGLHLYLFLAEPVPAKDIQECLQSMASLLGFGDKEIFPKQTIRGAVGNWVNMPYFGNTRRCLSDSGKEMTLEEFLDFVKPLTKLPKVSRAEAVRFPDGPPCLQAIAEYGPVSDHEKHDMLFALGTYFKMANKEGWADQLRISNSDQTLLPRGHTGIEQLIDDLTTHDYGYRCNNPPIKKYCDRALCMRRRFGVTRGACMPVTVVIWGDGQDSVVYATVWSQGKTHVITATVEEWFDPRKFAIACFKQIHDAPPPMKLADWQVLIGTLPKTSEFTADSPEDTLFDNLKAYCQAHNTHDRTDFLTNNKLVVLDIKKGWAMFKASTIARALNTGAPMLERLVAQKGGKNKAQTAFPGNKNWRLSWLPLDMMLEDLPLPPIPEDEEEPI